MNEQPFDTNELAILHRLLCEETLRYYDDVSDQKDNPEYGKELKNLKNKLKEMLIPPEIEGE